MKRYFMIIEPSGYFRLYSTEYWDYDAILKEINEYEFLKEINKNIRDNLSRKGMVIIKHDKIQSFLNLDIKLLDEEEIITEFFKEIKNESCNILTQEQRDIKFLAETLKGIIEPMLLPAEGEPNKELIKLQEIIDRYSS